MYSLEPASQAKLRVSQEAPSGGVNPPAAGDFRDAMPLERLARRSKPITSPKGLRVRPKGVEPAIDPVSVSTIGLP